MYTLIHSEGQPKTSHIIASLSIKQRVTFKSNISTIHRLMIPVLNVNWQSPSADYSLSERDADVLALIETEDLATFTFDGLKRRTGLHPETLSRILS